MNSRPFIVYDEIVQMREYIKPKDTLEMIQADQLFLQRLVDRLAKRELVDSKRMWLSREEIRNLRCLAGMNASNQYLDHLKDRRMRVNTVKQFLATAEGRIAARAAALVSEKIAPQPKARSDDLLNSIAHWRRLGAFKHRNAS